MLRVAPSVESRTGVGKVSVVQIVVEAAFPPGAVDWGSITESDWILDVPFESNPVTTRRIWPGFLFEANITKYNQKFRSRVRREHRLTPIGSHRRYFTATTAEGGSCFKLIILSIICYLIINSPTVKASEELKGNKPAWLYAHANISL